MKDPLEKEMPRNTPILTRGLLQLGGVFSPYFGFINAPCQQKGDCVIYFHLGVGISWKVDAKSQKQATGGSAKADPPKRGTVEPTNHRSVFRRSFWARDHMESGSMVCSRSLMEFLCEIIWGTAGGRHKEIWVSDV